VLTGYRSGRSERRGAAEPRAEYDPGLPLEARYAAKAAELGAGVRTVKRWVSRFRQLGEAGLAPGDGGGGGALARVDERWTQTALEVMAEHTGESKPSRKMVIERTEARLAASDGDGAVPLPSRATAYRVLQELERRRPTFRLSARRNQDIAARPGTAYGKLRPARPGEYLLMDTTRLDVFAVDPVTLRWLQAELTVAMDWYTRCITGVRLTPVSTKAVDAAAVLYQAFRPRPAAPGWPAHAAWPEHGIPRTVLVDRDAVTGPVAGSASPALVPETIVVDHGRVYVSEHITSVCQRLGISIQPARLRTGRDKPRAAYCTSSERLAGRWRSCRSHGVVSASLVEGRRVGSGRVVEDFAFVVIPLPADNSGVVPDLDGVGGHTERVGHLGERDQAGVEQPLAAAA